MFDGGRGACQPDGAVRLRFEPGRWKNEHTVSARTQGRPPVNFPILDADTHINEPPDLWEKRMPAKFADRAPRLVGRDNGSMAWNFETRQMTVTPLVNAVGTSPVQWTLFGRGYEGLRPGAWDPAARLEDMAIDMVGIHVLFPTYVLAGGAAFSKTDREYQIACVRVYNDWIAEFASYAPDRFIAVGLTPTTGVDDMIQEAKRVSKLGGIRGLLLTSWPNGDENPKHEEDDRFWSVAEDLDLACIIHQERQAISMIPIMSHFILGGVFERHPRLRVSATEVGAGWVPFFLEQTDDNFQRHRFWTNCKLSRLPSEYWYQNCFTTFQLDRYALRNRDLVGVHTMMWSSDYPHSGADWPASRANIDSQVRDIPVDEQRLILCENALRLYGTSLAEFWKGSKATAVAGTK
jgi:predicted TIM-barrel fold metal-dependent hydrolase